VEYQQQNLAGKQDATVSVSVDLWLLLTEIRPAGWSVAFVSLFVIIIIILFVSDTMVHSYIQKHTDTHRHTKTAEQLVKTIKTED